MDRFLLNQYTKFGAKIFMRLIIRNHIFGVGLFFSCNVGLHCVIAIHIAKTPVR